MSELAKSFAEPAGIATSDRPAAARRVHIKTYGCQMNAYDSERIAEALANEAYQETDRPEDADLVILNTCHIREKASEKVYSELGRLRDIKSERSLRGQTTLIAVAGCVAQAEGTEIARRAPAVDLVVGPQSYHKLSDLLRRAAAGRSSIVETAFPDDDKFAHLPIRSAPRATSAFLTVQEGCDKFCTFCVVPYTRGMEYSRPAAAVLDEARRLVAAGVRELTLLGQNVNAYHGEGLDGKDWSLARLICEIAGIDGLERLRYTTSHPRDVTDDLIAAHRDVGPLMPYLHLPVQSGADRILAAMNRKHTASEYRRIVERFREARPDIALSTDIIVGFPGETEDEFQSTMTLVRDVGFAQAFSFKYSARPGTPAANIADQVPEAAKIERLAVLQELILAEQTSFNAGCIGQTMPVLFEKAGRRDGQVIGKSPYLQSVVADAAQSIIGKILRVIISAAGPNSLSGVIEAS